MLNFLTVLLVSLWLPLASAQKVDVNEIQTAEEGTTTIEIKKNRPGEPATRSDAQWEVTSGDADVEGDSAATAKEARATWKKACDEWKKEFRSDNKENKILSINCGSVSCSGDAGNKICTSKATYKVKTKIN